MMKCLRLAFCGVVLAWLVSGCSSNSGNNGPSRGGPTTDANSLFTPTAADPVVPFPNDIFFADRQNTTGSVPGFTSDGTLNVPNTGNPPNPVVTDVNLLDGFSTTDTAYADFTGGDIDLDRANGPGVFLIDTKTAQPLTPTRDFEVVRSPVVTDHTRLLIRPLKPLAPGTTYIVVLTDFLRTRSGGEVRASPAFEIVASPDKVGSAANPASDYTPAQQAVLEQIRTTAVRPIFDQAIDPNPAIAADSVILTWSFTTQSIGASLGRLAGAPTPNPKNSADGGIRVQPLPDGSGGQLSTGEVNPGLADTANIYQGTVDLSYYLANDDSNANPPAPLTTFWRSDGDNAGGDSALPSPAGAGNLPCAAFSPSTSTTKCFPDPRLRSVESVPVLVTVPNANSPSGGVAPDGGWPVVIFQHGITANRTNVFAVAPALANAGFVTVAIDLPLHGLPPGNPFRIDGAERTFDLDADGDGTIDSSGANFINLRSPITSRDNVREAVTDLIDLDATVMQGAIAVAGGGNIPLDGQASEFLGHSLGAIVGSVLMGVTDDSAFDAATLANPGGGTIRLLDGSAAFGPTIAAGLAAAGVREGSPTYQSFLRLAQTVNDSADPINYASAASAGHALHLIEVVGGANNGNNPPDLVVPNAVVRNVSPAFTPAVAGACPATGTFRAFLDTVCVAGPLSGTDPLVAAMGLNTVKIAPAFPASTQPADTVVRFTSGKHSSILDPSTDGTPTGALDPQQAAATTAEMQCEAAGFLARAAAGGKPIIPIAAAGCP